MLFAGPSPPSPTHPATMVLAPHTILFSCRSCVGRHGQGGGWSLANRYLEQLNLKVITDFEAHLWWVAKQVQAHPNLKGNASVNHETSCITFAVITVAVSHSPNITTAQCTLGWRSWSIGSGIAWLGQSMLNPGTPAHSLSCALPEEGHKDLYNEIWRWYHVQNSSGAHPASYPMGTGGYFPGGKVARAWNWPLISI
jgi:hypothetical protein